MKKIIIATAVLAALTACNKTLIENPVSDSEYGYINLGLSADTQIVETKSGESSATQVTGTEAATYNIYLYKVESSVKTLQEGYPKEFSALTNDVIKVSQGTYIIAAENFTEAESENSNALRLYGESSQTVTAGQTYNVSVTCTAANAKVSVIMSEEFNNNTNFPSPVLTVTEINDDNVNSSNPPRTITISDVGQTHDEAANYFTADDTASDGTGSKKVAKLSYTLTTTASDNTKKTWSGSISALPAYWTKITLAPGQNGKITVSIYKNEGLTILEPQVITLDPTDGK